MLGVTSLEVGIYDEVGGSTYVEVGGVYVEVGGVYVEVGGV